MRVLLVTDTHGHLDCINDLADQTRADAVLHAGDLGFYDEGSIERLTDRELALRIRHSDLPTAVRKGAFGLSRDEKVELITQQAPLSDLPAYIAGTKRFHVPVYAVWGNHEDIEVVRAFRDGRRRVENLHLLDETGCCFLGGLCVFGLGGNLLPGRRLFHMPLAGGGGRIWTTLSQYARLWKTVVEHASEGAARVFVSHVSPGKEPILRRLAAHLRADFVVSGHMGSPYCLVWNEFAIRTVEQAEEWLRVDLGGLRKAWEAARRSGWQDDDEAEMVELGLRLLETLPEGTRKAGKGNTEPLWYRDNLLVNLPDAADGYALLIEEDGRVRLETYSDGLTVHCRDLPRRA